MSKRYFVPIVDNGLGYVTADYTVSLISALCGLEVQISRASDSHANRGMNKVACDFLASSCEEMLILDGDVIVTRSDIERLISHKVSLVYGIYPKRQPNFEMCLCTFENFRPTPPDTLAVVRRAGRGYMRVSRAVFEAMKEDNGGPALRYHNHGRIEWDFFPSGPVTGAFSAMKQGTDEDGYPIREWLSEDWYFCEVARSLGFPTLVDQTIMAKHQGICTFPIKELLPRATCETLDEQAKATATDSR